MNKLNFLLKGLTVVSVAILFAQCANNSKVESTTTSANSTSTNSELKLAYVDVDSLLTKYKLSIDINEEMVKKAEDIRLTLNQKANALAKEKQEFQSKVENNAFLSKERAEQEYTRLLKKERELEELNNKLQAELAEANMNNTQRLRDSISTYLKEYNTGKKYSMIFSRTGFENILHAEDSYNITKEIVDGLNSRYTSEKK